MPAFRRLAPGLAVAVGAACIPPEVRLFDDPPPGLVVIAEVVDTLLLQRLDPSDSVAVETSVLAADIARAAGEAGRNDAARIIASVLPVTPPDTGQDVGPEDIVVRVQRQGLAQMLDLIRADALFMRDVAADTLERPGEDEVAPPERWVALILRGTAVIDSTFGRRLEAEWQVERP